MVPSVVKVATSGVSRGVRLPNVRQGLVPGIGKGSAVVSALHLCFFHVLSPALPLPSDVRQRNREGVVLKKHRSPNFLVDRERLVLLSDLKPLDEIGLRGGKGVVEASIPGKSSEGLVVSFWVACVAVRLQ